MASFISLRDEDRRDRRTIADALEVIRAELGIDEVGSAKVMVGPLQLPTAPRAAIVVVLFPDLGCCVSLATSSRFKARSGTSARHEFDISRLHSARVSSDGSLVLADATQLRAVEVVPTNLPYELSELQQRIIGHVIRMTGAYHCFRNFRDELPEIFREGLPDLWALDFSRLRTIQAPPLKEIRGDIQDNDPDLRVSNQTIADTLAMCGVRNPRRRRPAQR